MTFTAIVKDIFTRTPKSAKDNSQQGGAKRFLSKISGAFMLPISVMAIAGLFLGVGAAIESHTDATTFGLFIKNLGDPVFSTMPLLFMVAIVISFTDDIGTAVFAGIVGYFVFNALQTPFIHTVSDASGKTGVAEILGIGSKDINIGSDHFSHKFYNVVGKTLGTASLSTSVFGGIVVGFITSWAFNKFSQVELPAMISFFGGKRFVPFVVIILMIPTTFLFLLLWPWVGTGFAYIGIYSGKVKGLDSFVFGYIERALIPFGLHHVFYAALWWTAAGGDMNSAMTDFTNAKGSIDSINNGAFSVLVTNQDTIHHTVDSLLAVKAGTTPVFANVGALSSTLNTYAGSHTTNNIIDYSALTGDQLKAINTEIMASVNTQLGSSSISVDVKTQMLSLSNVKLLDDLNQLFISKITANGTYQGDSFGWLAVNGSGIDEVDYTGTNGVKHTGVKVFKFIDDGLGIYLGRFMHGKFAFMQLGLPAAGAAMIMAAPKENRKTASAVIIPACATSFVTGVTEPIEFTFVFLAPALFWGFHSLMAAFSFMMMTLLGAHVGMTFSGGIIDTIIYGAVPYAKGTNFYWMYVIGAVLAPIYYFFFLWYIKKFNLSTPGRGGNTKLFTKADFKASKGASGGLNPQGAAIVQAFGGWNNITKFANCATRLRYDVVDASKVDDAALKAAGAMGVSRIGKSHVQAIMGPQAEQINGNIKVNKGADLGSNNAVSSTTKKETKTVALTKAVTIASPIKDGTVKTLTSLKDGVFSKKMMGDGIVVSAPASKKTVDYFAPVSGELVTVFPTGHAYGIKTKDGVEVLLHIGLDTVNLKGEGFKPSVKQGDQVKVGDKLVTVDVASIKGKVPSTDGIVIITSAHKIKTRATGKITASKKLLTLA